jgi:hypothetical protein
LLFAILKKANNEEGDEMKKTHYIALSIIALLLGACGEAPERGDAARHDQVCPGSNPNPTVVVITYVDPSSSVNPKPTVNQNEVFVRQGDKIKFILNGPNKNVVVSTSGKTKDAGWLNGGGVNNSNHPGSERFFVCVPKDFIDWNNVETQCDKPGNPRCKKFEYDVMATDHETLDPVVTVQEF